MPESPDDLELVERVAQGDSNALSELFQRHTPRLLALGQRIVGGMSEAEDVLLELFWELWQHPQRFDPARGTLQTYLTLRMRSRCLDRLRAQRTRSAYEEVAHRQGSQSVESAAEVTLRQEALAGLRQAVQTLAETERAVVELAYYEGLSHREIAQRLALPVGTVKTRLRNGLLRLRRLFQQQGGPNS